MKMKRSSKSLSRIFVISILLISLSIAACTQPTPAPQPIPSPVPAPTPTPASSVTLDYIISDAVGAPVYKYALAPFATEIEKLTEGRVKVKIYPMKALGPITEHYDLVKNGVADVGWIFPGINSGRFPIIAIGGLTFAWDRGVQAPLAMELMRHRGAFDKETAEVKILGMSSAGMYRFFFRDKKVTNLEDLKNLNMRVSGDYQVKAVERLGMTPILMPATEISMALETGVLDGVVASYGMLKNFGMVELVKYGVDLGFYSPPTMWVINRDTWGQISEQDQKTIEAIAVQVGIRYALIEDISDDGLLVEFRQGGMEIVSFSDADTALAKEITRPTWDEFITDVEAQGFPGSQIMADFQQIREELGLK